MKRYVLSLFIGMVFILGFVVRTHAADFIAEDEITIRRAIAEKNMRSIQQIKSAAIEKVFNLKFGMAKSEIGIGTIEQFFFFNGQDVFLVQDLSTKADLSDLVNLIKPDFLIHNGDDVKSLSDALDDIFPLSDKEKKLLQELSPLVRNVGDKRWVILRGFFFDNFKGFVVKTDGDGRIVSLDWELKVDMSSKDL